MEKERLDVRIDTDNFQFKFRVCGIIVNEGKALLVRIKDNKFYCMPGGHVELGENTQAAVIREMKEETGYDLAIDKLLSITENFFDHKGKLMHEIAYYYIMKPLDNNIDMNDKEIIELDKGKEVKLTFHWWDMKEDLDMRPKFIKEKLMSGNLDFETAIIND